MKTDVIIVGGGISGLYTALKCLHQGFRVTIIEKHDKLGGRIKTIYDDGYMFEAGAGRFHAKHTILRGLIGFFGLHEVKIDSKHTYLPDPSFHEMDSIQRVIKYVTEHQVPKEVLQQIPFISLCRTVLGRPLARKVTDSFGYNAEFELMNAYDAIRMFERDFSAKARYFVCQEGLSTLIERMATMIKQMRGLIFTKTHVTDIKRTTNGFKVSATDGNGKQRVYNASAVVCAIPKESLEDLKFFSKDQRNLMNTVVPVSLNRIYGTFPVSNGRSWFHGITRSTTDTKIRQFIPVNKKQGLAMVSYSDTSYADEWKKYADKGTPTLKKQLLKQLHITFPDIESIPEPQWLNAYYWPAGVHMWKPGVDSDTVIPQIQHILGQDSAFFIVGEAYAKNQAWIEGALESVETIFESLAKHVFKGQQGGNTQTPLEAFIASRSGVLTREDLDYMKQKFKKDVWVLLRHPKDGKTKVIYVNDWMNMHPGGPNVFTDKKHKWSDITDVFMNIPYHKNMRNEIKAEVINYIDQYTVATVV